MLEPYRVYLAPGGWRVTDGVKDYGAFESHSTAVKTADSLNRSWAPQEPRSFSPSQNLQGGALDDARRKGSTEPERQ